MGACPECDHDGGWEPIGPYRSMCLGCGALLKNTEIGENEDPADTDDYAQTQEEQGV